MKLPIPISNLRSHVVDRSGSFSTASSSRLPLSRFLSFFIAAFSILSPKAFAQTPAASNASPEQARVLATVESYLRNLFAWGPDFQLKLGPLKDATLPNFYEVPIEVTFQGQSQNGVVYASKDGKYIVRGELYKTDQYPFDAIRRQLTPDDSPSLGPAGAKVTLVEFSDFECPHCRQLREILKDLEPRYPQVRVVFKNFPIEHIHPWAMTAALAARCAYATSPAAFWKVHDAIFDQQDLITPENAYEKLTDLAVAAGVPRDTFKECVADPATKKAVDADLAVGVQLGVTSTPTVFVNGRESVGGDTAALEQLINYELHPQN